MKRVNVASLAILCMPFQSDIEWKGCVSLLPLVQSDSIAELLCRVAAY